jgi:AAHS family 4-hydroxybenzoate transporter-like MFS transporter
MTVDVNRIIAEQKFGGYHALIILMCAAAMFADGFDTQAMGYIAPDMTRDLALAPGALGRVFAISGAGNLVGALLLTPFADKWGRKPAILFCLVFFAIGNLATAWADSVSSLMVLRFVTGLGLGGLTPNALALTAEYMPERYKVSRVILVWYGFSIGSTVAGPLADALVKHWNWQAVFIAGAIPPVLFALALIPLLPESVLFLARRGGAPDTLARNLNRLTRSRAYSASDDFVSTEKREAGFPVTLLFKDGRASLTLLLWLMFFTNLLALYFMNSWLTTVLNNAGLSESAARNISAGTHIGGIIGGQLIAFACDKWGNGWRALAGAYLLSALFIAGIGASGNATLLATVTTFFAGFFTFGGQNTANALSATIYPTALRSSGAGWAIGVGRLAQIAAPGLGGVLLSLQWSSNDILYVVALPALVSVMAAVSISRLSGAARIPARAGA